jgi:hypothetical protein
MRHLLAAALVPLAFGCSILDPGDRDELRRQIAMMPRMKLTLAESWYMRDRALKWVIEKFNKVPNDQMGKIQCRDNEGGVWSNWYDRPDKVFTITDMWNCLLKKPDPTYLWCIDDFKEWVIPFAQKELKDLLSAFTDVECKYVWDVRYEPEKMDPKMIDPDAITADDLIDAMIAAPAPPPGLAIPELVPLLCPLGAGPGWGCPPRPSDPSPTGGQPTDPTGGDHQ